MAENQKLSTITTGAMLVAAVAALAGLGYLFSTLWGSKLLDRESILRIATDQYISGELITAGNLAEKVSFDTDPESLLEEALPPENTDDETPSVEAEPVSDADVAKQKDAKQKQLAWVSVRDFLVGAGKFTQGLETEDLLERRQLYRQALPSLRASQQNGFPQGRNAEGNRMLGETLFELAQYENAASVLQQAILQDPALQQTLLPMIAESQRDSVKRHSSDALETIEGFLQNPNLNPSQHWQGELIRLRCLLKDRDYGNLQNLVDEIQSRPRETHLVREISQGEFPARGRTDHGDCERDAGGDSLWQCPSRPGGRPIRGDRSLESHHPFPLPIAERGAA